VISSSVHPEKGAQKQRPLAGTAEASGGQRGSCRRYRRYRGRQIGGNGTNKQSENGRTEFDEIEITRIGLRCGTRVCTSCWHMAVLPVMFADESSRRKRRLPPVMALLFPQAGDSEIGGTAGGGSILGLLFHPVPTGRTRRMGGSSRNCRYLLCGAVRNTASLQVPARTRPRVPGTLHLTARPKHGGTLSLFVYISLLDRRFISQKDDRL
jgi:hypothetical protein